VLLEQGAAEEGRSRTPAVPRRIGCTAHISQVQPLPEGRMNLVVVGRERFRVHEFIETNPYLSAIVEPMPMTGDGVIVDDAARLGLGRCMSRYLQVLEKAGRIQQGARKLPKDLVTLASLAAVMLHDLPAAQRQSLLETEDLPTMYDELRAVYRREIVLLEAMLTEPQDDHIAPFSPN
jgi:Lon protease-like protein